MKLIDLFFESELDEYRSSYSNGRIDSTKFKPGTRVSHPLMGPNLGTIVDPNTIPIEDRRSTGVPVKPDRTNKIYWLSPGSLEILSENTQPKPDTVAKTWDQMTPKEKSSGVKGRTEWNEKTRKYRTVFDVPVEKKPEQDMSEGPNKSSSIPDWTALGEDLTVEDKISIFEAYYANGAILESDENSVEYFKGLNRFSVNPVKNKKYIVTPLMLIQNRVLSLNTELLKLTFVDSVGNQLIFARDDGTTIKFPESHQSNQGLTHTFVFNKISTYDKFRTELSLKFDLTLPDVLSEGKKVDSFVDAVKKSEIKAGHAAKEAESIAWATANKRGMLNNKNTKKK